MKGDYQLKLYYKEIKAGNYIINISDNDLLQDKDISLKINPSNLAKISITSESQNLIAGEPSNLITLETRDIYDNTVLVQSPIQINLSSNSTDYLFSDKPDFGNIINEISITKSSVSVYYKR